MNDIKNEKKKRRSRISKAELALLAESKHELGPYWAQVAPRPDDWVRPAPADPLPSRKRAPASPAKARKRSAHELIAEAISSMPCFVERPKAEPPSAAPDAVLVPSTPPSVPPTPPSSPETPRAALAFEAPALVPREPVALVPREPVALPAQAMPPWLLDLREQRDAASSSEPKPSPMATPAPETPARKKTPLRTALAFAATTPLVPRNPVSPRRTALPPPVFPCEEVDEVGHGFVGSRTMVCAHARRRPAAPPPVVAEPPPFNFVLYSDEQLMERVRDPPPPVDADPRDIFDQRIEQLVARLQAADAEHLQALASATREGRRVTPIH